MSCWPSDAAVDSEIICELQPGQHRDLCISQSKVRSMVTSEPHVLLMW